MFQTGIFPRHIKIAQKVLIFKTESCVSCKKLLANIFIQILTNSLTNWEKIIQTFRTTIFFDNLVLGWIFLLPRVMLNEERAGGTVLISGGAWLCNPLQPKNDIRSIEQ